MTVVVFSSAATVNDSASDSMAFLRHCALYKFSNLLTYLLTHLWHCHWYHVLGLYSFHIADNVKLEIRSIRRLKRNRMYYFLKLLNHFVS